MPLKHDLSNFAASLGFSGVYAMRPERFTRWGEHIKTRADLPRLRVVDDPRLTMPNCKSVVLLVWPYQPYEPEPEKPVVSAYYIASNTSHGASRRVAQWLRDQGHEAISDANIPEKALAERVGAARYGRNGIAAAPGLGSRIAFQSILTDAEIAPDPLYDGHELSDECQHCERCARVCPVGALKGDALVDGDKCLRALPMNAPFPVEAKRLIGASLLGCDLCQDCCPRNERVGRVRIPENVLDALSLERMLAGDMSAAAALLGANYARKKRMQARACIVAANLNRTDCLPLIRPLLKDDSELMRDAAQWAAQRLMDD